MISRPTTDQLILDCCRELMEEVLPTLTDETTQVRVIMIDTVLRNAAVRAQHEIAWMRDEIAAIDSYAADTLAALPDATGVLAAQDALAAAPADSLHLADVVERYSRAGALLSLSVEAAVLSGHADLVGAGETLLAGRLGREHEVMAGWSPTGR